MKKSGNRATTDAVTHGVDRMEERSLPLPIPVLIEDAGAHAALAGHRIGILSLLAVLAVVPCVKAMELANNSFEDPGGDGSLWISDRAEKWERWGAWFNRETQWKPVSDGQCIMAYHHWKINGDDTAGIYQDVPNLPATKEYTFSIAVSKDKFTNAEYVEVRLEPYLGGETIASRVYRMNDLKSGKWTPVSVTGKSTTVGMRVLVIVKPGRTTSRKGSVKFDSAAFRPATGEEIINMDPPVNNQMYGTMRPRR